MRFDWLDLIEGPFRAFARLSNKEQWAFIVFLWLISVACMVLDYLLDLLF